MMVKVKYNIHNTLGLDEHVENAAAGKNRASEYNV